MEIVEQYLTNGYTNQTESSIDAKADLNLDISKSSKVTDYFDYIYSYPPKIKIKWNTLDELNEDLFIGSNYGVLEHSLPFLDFIADWFFTESQEDATSENYSKSQYVDGFLDKINSSNFFLKKTKKIQSALSNVPVFVIVNGQGEIVLSKPANLLEPKNLNSYLGGKLYDVCGGFDPLVEKNSELGLFFLDQTDAEKYLKEVARADFEGVQTVGLSTHCVSLDTAYKITREYHPGIDFRFVPKFSEVKELLTRNVGKADMVIEDEQQQLRFRRRNVNLFPYLNKLGAFLSPNSSFLQRNEYFKGVPIYIVQVSEEPRNFITEKYFNIVGALDTIYGRFIQSIDYTAGFGHNWIMQGSLQEKVDSDKFTNYVFFEKDQAIEFSKKNGRKVSRYKGSRNSNVAFMIRKPKIFVYNLEDFIEDWEDTILGQSMDNEDLVKPIFKSKGNYFVSPHDSSLEVENYYMDKNPTPLKDWAHTLNVKFRVFKRAAGIFFSIN